MRGLKIKTRAFGPVLTTAFAVFMTAGAITSYGSSYYNYDWNSGASSGGSAVIYSTREEDDEETGIGPGIILDMGSGMESGPSVSQSAVTEQYHADYKVYEESIEGLFFFYSNVANGGISHEPVILDLPANLTWTVEKDGAPWTYESKQPITEYGTYVFRLSGIEDTSVPLSEQKEYRGVFRFRIQEKPPEELAEDAGNSGFSMPSGSYGYDSGLASGGMYLGSDGLQTETEAETWETAWFDSAAEEEEEALPAAAEAEETESQSPEAEPEEETDGEERPVSETEGDKTANKAAFTQVYDVSSKKYQVSFENGIVILSSVPGGYMGSGPVQITLPKEGLDEISLYKDDELLQMAEGSSSLSFQENGYYRVETGGSSWSFALFTASSRVDIYPAPVGMTFKEASLDGESLTLVSKDYVLMEEDGQYALTMEGAEGNTLTVGLKKDTEAPVMEISLSRGEASIQYLSDDITELRLEKSGELVENFNGYSVTSPGDYQLTISDEAGNTESASFSLKYQVNSYGVAAVVLIILVIIGIVIFVIHTKRNVKIR